MTEQGITIYAPSHFMAGHKQFCPACNCLNMDFYGEYVWYLMIDDVTINTSYTFTRVYVLIYKGGITEF